MLAALPVDQGVAVEAVVGVVAVGAQEVVVASIPPPSRAGRRTKTRAPLIRCNSSSKLRARPSNLSRAVTFVNLPPALLQERCQSSRA